MAGPSGTVTLLFTDIEGSTRAWEAHPAEMQIALQRHDALLRGAIESADGYVFKTVGDAFCAAFGDPNDALRAAVDAQRALDAEAWPDETPIRVRMGLHTGVCEERGGDYLGPPVNRVARLQSTAHGGQTVLSAVTNALLGEQLPDGVRMRDLGEHRLKDLGQPEHVFQVDVAGLNVEFPALRSLSNPALPNNLPEQTSSFVGRDRELDEVRALLDQARLVTLTGPGGAGKTRLALQAAAELLDGSGDGVWLVDLAALTDPDLVTGTVSAALGVREDASQPMMETLIDAIRDRALLVVLDNCEHVIDAVAKLADAVLRSSPRIELLATSREPLGITGEHVYRVPSLTLPDGDTTDPAVLGNSEAVRLFIDRAAQHTPGFILDDDNAMTIASICRRLDGIPLAIELAAARLRSLSVDDLDARLDQRFRILTGGSRTALPRQQTLQALMDWSWDLLTETERAVLCRLAVFSGGWDLPAAEAVAAGPDVEGWEVLDHLTALVDKSLVHTDDQAGSTRYRLLETVRDYAAAKLAGLGEVEATRTRLAHRDHYLAWAELAAPELEGPRQAEWLGRVEREQDNLRAAVARSLGEPDPEPAFRFVVALHRFWTVRGRVTEGCETGIAVVGRPEAAEPTVLRGRALVWTAEQQCLTGGHVDASDSAKEALEIGRAHEDPDLTTRALAMLQESLGRQGQSNQILTDEALEIARATGDPELLACALRTRLFENLAPELVETRRRADQLQALEIYRRRGDHYEVARLLNNVANDEIATRDLTSARAHLTESREISCSLGASFLAELFNLGLVDLLEGGVVEARRKFTETLATSRQIGDRSTTGYAVLGLALTEGDPASAAKLHGAGDAIFDGQEQLERLEQTLSDNASASLRTALGHAAFDAAYAAGRSLSREDAVAFAARLAAGPEL